MTSPILPDSLCRPGREFYAEIPAAAGHVEALAAWKAFSEHAIRCQFCYRPVAAAGGLARMWKSLAPLKEATT